MKIFSVFSVNLCIHRLRPAWKLLFGLGLIHMGCDNLFDPLPAEIRLPLNVEYTGCQSVNQGPLCVLGEKRTLTIWVKTDPLAALSVQGDRNTAITGPDLIQGGKRYKLKIGKTTPEISVEAVLHDDRSSWKLKLSEPNRPPWLEQAVQQGRAGEIEKAKSLVLEHLEKAPASHQAQAESLLARLHLGLGNLDSAEKYFRSAIPKHTELGHVSAVMDDSTALAHSLAFSKDDITQARSLINSVLNYIEHASATEIFSMLYVQGQLASRAGNLRIALEQLNSCHLIATRLDMQKESLSSGQVLANLFELLGRRKEASNLFEQLYHDLPEDINSCKKAMFLNSWGWNLILISEAGGNLSSDTISILHKAYAIFEEKCTGMTKEHTNVLINLSLAYLHAGNHPEASAYIEKARSKNPDPDMVFVLWILEVEARLALSAGQPEKALLLYTKQQELSEHIQDPISIWRSTIGLARSFKNMGKHRMALKSYQQAEKLLDQASLRVGLGEGRAGFLAQHQSGTQEYLSLLLAMNKPEEALLAARTARIRAFLDMLRADRLSKLDPAHQKRRDRAMSAYLTLRKKLDQQAALDWRLPQDQLTLARQTRKQDYESMRKALDQALSLDPQTQALQGSIQPKSDLSDGEMLLFYFPKNDGWLGFAADRSGVTTTEIQPLPPRGQKSLLPSLLLKPFSAVIQRNRKIRVLPMGRMYEVDFHALDWGKDVLLKSKQVAYSLDLPGRTSPAGFSNPGSPRRALVVVDPQSDLPEASKEAFVIQENLEKRKPSWPTLVLHGTKSTPEAFRLGIANADLLHFSGHAVYRGYQGWDSALLLADGAEIGIGDIFALDRPPRRVVLIGCETGRTAAASYTGLGLAQAFLFAGSRLVIATSRKIDDRLAAKIASVLYAEPNLEPADQEAYRKTLLRVKEQLPAEDWAGVRLIIP